MKTNSLLPNEKIITASKNQITLFEDTLRAELIEKNPLWTDIPSIFCELLTKAEQNIPIDKTKERRYFTEYLATLFFSLEKEKLTQEIEHYFQKIISAYLALAEQQYWAHQIYAISCGQHEKMLATLKKTCDAFEEKTATIDKLTVNQLIKLKMDMAAIEVNHHVFAESLRAMPLEQITSLLHEAKINWEESAQAALSIFPKPSILLQENLTTIKSCFNELDDPIEIKNQLEQWSWYFQVMLMHSKNKISTQLDDYLLSQQQKKQQQPLPLKKLLPNAKQSLKDKIMAAFCCGEVGRTTLSPSSGGLFNPSQKMVDNESPETKNILHPHI